MVKLCKRYFGLSVIGMLFLLSACEQKDTVMQNDSNYASIDIGRYWVYEVHEEQYSLTDAPVLSTYYLKETIGDVLSTMQGNITHKLIRYKRIHLTDSWKADSVWTVQQWPDKMIRTENNASYVKLIFPISAGTSWNQNQYNTLPVIAYQYEKVGNAYTLAPTIYPNTLQVVNKQNDSTAISFNRQVDVYAYQTGLISKENTALAYCQSSPDCIGKEEIAYGYRTKWALIETGKE